MSSAGATTNPNLVIGRIPLFHRGDTAAFRYSHQTFGTLISGTPASGEAASGKPASGILTFWTLAFHENEGDEFTQLFNQEMTSGQCVVSVCLPSGQEFYLSGGFSNRPFIAGVFGDLVVVQVCEKVYCLSISNELAIEHTFTLSKPLGQYHSACCDDDFLDIYYYPVDNIPEDPDDVYAIPTKDVFHLGKW